MDPFLSEKSFTDILNEGYKTTKSKAEVANEEKFIQFLSETLTSTSEAERKKLFDDLFSFGFRTVEDIADFGEEEELKKFAPPIMARKLLAKAKEHAKRSNVTSTEVSNATQDQETGSESSPTRNDLVNNGNIFGTVNGNANNMTNHINGLKSKEM